MAGRGADARREHPVRSAADLARSAGRDHLVNVASLAAVTSPIRHGMPVGQARDTVKRFTLRD